MYLLPCVMNHNITNDLLKKKNIWHVWYMYYMVPIELPKWAALTQFQSRYTKPLFKMNYKTQSYNRLKKWHTKRMPFKYIEPLLKCSAPYSILINKHNNLLPKSFYNGNRTACELAWLLIWPQFNIHQMKYGNHLI